jgi:exonuclease VII small subunit
MTLKRRSLSLSLWLLIVSIIYYILVTNQIEVLQKKYDGDGGADRFKKSSSTKSMSTMNNTLFDESGDDNIAKCVTSEFKACDAEGAVNTSNTSIATADWRKEIEKSIERISEKVASNNSNVLVAVLEKRVNEINSENAKLKKAFEDYVENSNLIRKSHEKFEKSEKLLQELITQVSSMKNSNLQYQTDFLKNLNEFNEKILNQELMWEQFETFETKTNKNIENLINEANRMANGFKSLTENKNKLTDRLDALEERTVPEIMRALTKFKDEFVKNEGMYIKIYISSQYEGFMGFTCAFYFF